MDILRFGISLRFIVYNWQDVLRMCELNGKMEVVQNEIRCVIEIVSGSSDFPVFPKFWNHPGPRVGIKW